MLVSPNFILNLGIVQEQEPGINCNILLRTKRWGYCVDFDWTLEKFP
jgi:hypothetical protein